MIFEFTTPKKSIRREGQEFSFMKSGREKITEMIRKQPSFLSHSFGLTTERTENSFGGKKIQIMERQALTEEQTLLIAIAEDDVTKFQQVAFSLDQILSLKFEGEMNVLNLAIDSQSTQIVSFLGASLNKVMKEKLTEHEFQGIRAIH
jgi:regulator of sigma D